MAQEGSKRESSWERLYFLSCSQEHDYGLGNVTIFPYLIWLLVSFGILVILIFVLFLFLAW